MTESEAHANYKQLQEIEQSLEAQIRFMDFQIVLEARLVVAADNVMTPQPYSPNLSHLRQLIAQRDQMMTALNDNAPKVTAAFSEWLHMISPSLRASTESTDVH